MNILIVANKDNPKTIDALFQIVAYLDAQGIGHVEIDVTDLPESAFPYLEHLNRGVVENLPSPIELIVTLGGDGTLLHSARLAAVLNAPLMGMNFGHLGFLANTVTDSTIALLADALSGEISHEQRVNLKVRVECIGDELEPPEGPREFFALNEIAIARGAMGHILEFDLDISGDRVAHMRGDGVVVSTATGSTAYALSAGGPLVGPRHRGMIAVPLAPHTLNSRAIVTEHHDVVEVRFAEDSASAREVSLFADGDALEFERPIANVVVTCGDYPTVILNRRDESFYRQIARTFFD